jgi:pimeloyl-ACP methyl ester carboxylesterase
MALIDCKFFSETLGMCSSMRVILPETTERRIGSVGVSRAAGGASFRGHPTLWLLHGLSDDESVWSRLTSIERYVAPLGLSVVMPNVNRSFYANMRSGYRYWDFVSQELLEKVRGFFPLSSAREDNFVAGLSMGGYGALKLAFTLPEQFAAAASLSGVTDVVECRVDCAEDFMLIFGAGGPERGSAQRSISARHFVGQLWPSQAEALPMLRNRRSALRAEHALPRRGPGPRLRLPLRRRAGRSQLGLLGQDDCPNPHLARARLEQAVGARHPAKIGTSCR